MLHSVAVPSILKSFALLSDATRVRLLSVLRQEELSVAELQEILGSAQSNISAQLARLKAAGLVSDRRSGKNRLYRLVPPAARERDTHDHLMALLDASAQELQEAKRDLTALKLIRRKRADTARAYFDALAGKFGRHYIPGRSWKALSEMLLHLLPPSFVVTDLGAGEGTLSQMLAKHVKQVIAVDNSGKMVAYGAKLAKEHGFANLDYRLGDIEDPPVRTGTVDAAIFSQALHHAHSPRKAVCAAHRILKSGGHVVILELLRHGYEKARQLYADVWLGFSEVELHELLEDAGFGGIQVRVVDRDARNPQFQIVLAVGRKR